MRFTIGQKLLLSFSAILIVLGGVGIYSLSQINYLASLTADMYNHPLVVTRAVLTAHVGIIKMHRGMKDLVLARTEEDQQLAKAIVDEYEHEVLKQFDIVRAAATTNEGRALVDETETVFKGWQPIRGEVIELISVGQTNRAATITRTKGADYVKSIEEHMISLQDYAKSNSEEMLNNAGQSQWNVLVTSAVALLVALLGGSLLAYSIARSITVPLKSAVAVAGQIAAGNLQVAVEHTRRHDEIGVLANSLTVMIANLREQIEEIVKSADTLTGSISQISTATGQLTANATETATAVNETTTTIEEVRQTAQVSTEKARYVSDIAAKSLQKSQAGREASDRAINGMNHVGRQMESIAESIVRLSEQSQAIGEIIATVDDVAEQSNLLAVNAAIEAAKAGEHGKGFAVVAQEIKSLAEQSKLATNQVRRILTDIQKATGTAVMATEQGSKAVEAGLQQTFEAGAAISTLTESVSEAAQAAMQIAASSQQQLVGMDQVAMAMENINQASTQNVDGARQLSLAAHGLEGLGQNLKVLVDRYAG